MKKLFLSLCIVAWLIWVPLVQGQSEELPIPSYQNSVVVSIELPHVDSAEVDYIKANFNFGMYSWLSFTWTSAKPVLDWHTAWDQADAGIATFKTNVNNFIQKAKDKDVLCHLVLGAGLVRGPFIYREAKEEDIRSAQWYNDNNLASDLQILDSDAMDEYIWSTLSRYARKKRRNLEAKSQAALAFLKGRMDSEPDTLYILSGWAEMELNYNRINQSTSIQDSFCDYSPFAVLEFRDWITHTGMYDNSTGVYAGEGYAGGGTKYQGPTGLALFNTDFGTSFTSWDLKYFHWSLADDYDEDPTDMVNNDPNRIPFASYSHGGMMPTSGPNYIASGFDPPRVMSPGNAFWDLWNLFRETMVLNCVNDLATWASDAGVPAERWFSHQLPGDYLFGTRPSDVNKNARYYSSASPLWTADIKPLGSVGATIYDVKYPPEVYPPVFARSTLYGLDAAQAMATNWAIMEYDAETYPFGLTVAQSTPSVIYDQFMNVYNHNAHVINFWMWWDASGEHRIKGMNKEIALQDFVEAIKDKGRRTTPGFAFDPPQVVDAVGSYNPGLGALVIDIGTNIWNGQTWLWQDWGDFAGFEIYRSTTPGFTPDLSNRIASTVNFSYSDTAYIPNMVNYYRVKAVNSKGITGTASEEIMLIPSVVDVPVLSVEKHSLIFGAEQGTTVTSPENVAILNIGPSGTTLNWTAIPSTGWLQVTPGSGTGNTNVSVGANIAGLSAGSYMGQITVSAPAAFNSPQIINVSLTVHSAAGESDPFGQMDTPVHNSTVSGNIPVTGWALDDVEVTRVELKRSSHATDPPVVIGPDGLVYIGDALFVKGARPDVAAAYPTYPRNDRAGWGYMLLTNFFPNQGNGPFTLYAFAYDGSGNAVQVGQKGINTDNANRVLPFGTIDTPAQGETISGTWYANFGWALTPLPKIIPIDGSTIWVYIDGVPLGNPSYNHYRADIATLFPGYLNSNGAVGNYILNTTNYTNGVHNIAWSVTDDDGAVDGVGSRYFEVQNLGGSAQGDFVPLADLQMQEDATGNLRIEGVEIKDFSHTSFGSDSTRDRALSQARDSKAELDTPAENTRASNSSRTHVIEIEQLGRIEINFETSGSGLLMGWGENDRSPLPLGSTLDRAKGVFYWIPGPGFLGKHELHFAVTDGLYRSKPVTVVFDIKPKR